MKRIILFFSILLVAGSIHAQDIFKQHGYDRETLTLSKGRYKETFINENVMQIGTVLIDTRTDKVVRFLEEDATELAYKAENTSRFLTPDPLAEKYPQLSPYAYCANNPVRYIDPDGRDIWEINAFGEIIKRMKDKTQDAFYMVAKDAEGNYQRTFTTDADGNKNYNSISFKYGTVTSVQEKSVKTNVGEVTLTMFNIKGDDNATRLFEFMSNPDITTNVEWSHDKIGTEKSGKNIVGTIHLPKNTVQGNYLSNKDYTIREDNHSHPGGTEKTSPGDEQVAKYILEKNRKASLNIYIPQKKKYIPYNANGVITK
jgi:hypothetical protein